MNSRAQFIALAVFVSAIAAEVEERTIQTDSGRLTFAAPKGWPECETRRTPRGTFYEFFPANTNYDMRLFVNDPVQTRTNKLTDDSLEHFIESSLSGVARKTVEGKIQAHRFGGHRDGVFARITDPAPKPAEYRYYTRGVRLIGTNVLVFALVSNDPDFSVLSNTLAVVESLKLARKEGRR
jgi:hypothetical protein